VAATDSGYRDARCRRDGAPHRLLIRAGQGPDQKGFVDAGDEPEARQLKHRLSLRQKLWLRAWARAARDGAEHRLLIRAGQGPDQKGFVDAGDESEARQLKHRLSLRQKLWLRAWRAQPETVRSTVSTR